jgi:hypothetical protein
MYCQPRLFQGVFPKLKGYPLRESLISSMLLQKGKWIGTQILPVSWIDEATTKKTEQAPDAPQAEIKGIMMSE